MASKVDTTDPAVRRLVYNHYRGILGKYNERANNIVSQLPKARVVEDQGITKQLESMIRQSNQIQSNGSSNITPVSANGPPPPPPPPCPGNLPAVRIASEVGPRKQPYEPPAAIQNAMMTKDKKPFTYTPGGLDLSEIRSPRMARRISRNAHTEDSCTPVSQQQAPCSPPGQPLPPAALAAMQPQIAIPVFPPAGGAPPPPPPPPPLPSSFPPPASSATQAPLPPPVSPSKQPLDFPPRPEFLSDIASHPPLRPVGLAPRSSYEPQSSTIQVQLKPVSTKASLEQVDSGTTPQVPFVPRPQVEIPVQNIASGNQGGSPPAQNQKRTPPLQTVITPETQLNQQFKTNQPLKAPQTPPVVPVKAPPTPPVQYAKAPSTPPVQQVKAATTPPIQQVRAPPTPPIQPVTAPQTVSVQRQPQTPSTPTLNKSPAPWLTNKPAPKESQPPWAVRQHSAESQPQTQSIQQFQQPGQQIGQQPVTRVIPIQIEGRESSNSPHQQYSQAPPKHVQPPQSQQYPTHQQQYQQASPNYPQSQPQYYQPSSQQQYANFPPQTYAPPQYQQYGPLPSQPQYAQQQPPQQDSQGRTRIIPIQIEGGNGNQQPTQKNVFQTQISQTGNRSQNGEADPRKFQTQTSWSGNPTQSRSFRVLQKITGSDDDPQASLQQVPQGEVILVNRVYPQQATDPASGEFIGWGTNTPPLYPNYWYNPPQTPEEQQQFWEHYNAMCSYMAHMNATAMRYSPYPFPPYPYLYPPYPSDTEDYSNSSSDEMTIYGKMFKEQAQQLPQQVLNPNVQPTIPSPNDTNGTESEADETSDSDTEVEEKPMNPIASIRSVPNINVYACDSSDDSSEESESSEDDDEETEDDSIPHQLSVIFEESDFSSEESRKSSVKSPYESDNSSSSTLKNKDDDETAVKVRLPIKLKFTRSENDEEVATLIVGKSEMEASKNNETEDSSLIITEIVREESDPNISATVILPNRKPKEIIKKREDSPIDFWKELNGENNDSVYSPKTGLKNFEDDGKQDESDFHWEDDSSSTSVQTVKKGITENDSSSEAEASGHLEYEESNFGTVTTDLKENNSDAEESSEEEKDEDDKESEGIKTLETEQPESEDEEDDSETSSTSSSSEDESVHSNVFHENSELESTVVKKKELINSKSFEESEDDSGVTSDLSRHISETDTDPECSSELSKMSRYQRAATHSRLFKLLQEQCEAEEIAEKEESISQRKERLTLPLNNVGGGDDSLSSSSGINSPSSPIINDRLVKELIQSLLSRKKGRHFRKLPIEKLHAAALRILQEDMDPYDSVSTSDESNLFLSPVSNCKKSNIATYTDNNLLNPESYGGNYYDYCNYYNTWGNADCTVEPEYDIVPSKTFKILQGQNQGDATGVKVRCPRVLSSKNIREQPSTPIPSFSSPIPKET